MRFTVLLLAALTLVAAASDAFARRGAHRGFHRHPHVVFFSGFYFGPPYFYGPPYYYGPAYAATPEPPSVYVEKFEGTPSVEISGEFYCPASGAYYPEVQDCGNGWQRVFRAPPSG
jgi:hypothetical protein